MFRRRHRVFELPFVLIVLCALVTGCGKEETAPPSADGAALNATCNQFAVTPNSFPVASIDRPSDVQTRADAATRELKAFVGNGADAAKEVPTSGRWVELARDDRWVHFGHRPSRGRIDWQITVSSKGNGWSVAKSIPCELTRVMPGFIMGYVGRINRDLNPDSTRIRLVTGVNSCHDGPAEMEVKESRKSVIVTARYRPDSGKRPVSANCLLLMEEAPRPVYIQLNRRLGRRTLLDGAAIPPKKIKTYEVNRYLNMVERDRRIAHPRPQSRAGSRSSDDGKETR